MKQKYILEIYDKLIKEIKYPANGKDSEIISFLKKESKESHYIHQIHFAKHKNKINYTAQQKVHNLHPLAPQLRAVTGNTDTSLEELIPQILNELNITEANIDYYWFSVNNTSSLIIKETCRIEDLSVEERFFLYCCQIVKDENHKILKNHKKNVFKLSSKVKMEHYIHRKQKALENLYYDLINDINPNVSKEIYLFSSDYDRVDCLKITYVYLEKLLVFLEKEYRNFLDTNTAVPYRTILSKELEIKDKINYIELRLEEITLSNNLCKIALLPLKKMTQIDIMDKITYSEFTYSCDYIEGLFQKLKLKIDVEELDIKEWLFDLNYNSLEFFDFKTDQINTRLKKSESEIDKIGTLYQLLKAYNQRPSGSHAKLNQYLPAIKDQILNWIDEEIEYLTRKNKLESIHINSQPIVKIKTCFSVVQLSYFFNLLVKCGILIPKNHSDIFRLICNNFKTEKTDKIAYKSVKNNYYAAELAALDYIRTKVISLLNFTKS